MTNAEMLLANIQGQISPDSSLFLHREEAARRLVDEYSVDFKDDITAWVRWLRENTDEIIDPQYDGFA